MAFPTAVNSQITDAVTQSNVKVVGEAPALAMGSIYQTLAHSTGILYANAVAAQQQMNTLAQAATNQGVIQIYSIDTTTTGGATDKVAQTGLTDNLTSLLTVLNAFRGERASTVPEAMQAAADSSATEDTEAGLHEAYEGLAEAIQSAVRFSNDTVLGQADPFNAAMRQCTDSVVYAIERIQQTQAEALRRMLLDALLVAITKALLQEPDRAKAFEEALQAVKRLE